MILTKEETEHRKDMQYMGFVLVNFFNETGQNQKYEYVKRYKKMGSELYLLIEYTK